MGTPQKGSRGEEVQKPWAWKAPWALLVLCHVFDTPWAELASRGLCTIQTTTTETQPGGPRTGTLAGTACTNPTGICTVGRAWVETVINILCRSILGFINWNEWNGLSMAETFQQKATAMEMKHRKRPAESPARAQKAETRDADTSTVLQLQIERQMHTAPFYTGSTVP